MKNRKVWLILGVAAVSIVGAPILYAWNFDRETAAREHAALARLRALHPLVPSIPEADNAAPFLATMAKKWKDEVIGENHDAVSPNPKPRAIAYIRDNDALIDHLCLIRTRQKLDFGSGPAAQESRIDFRQHFRVWIKALDQSAMLALKEGNTPKAQRQVRAAGVIYRLAAQDLSAQGPMFARSAKMSYDLDCLRLMLMAPDYAVKSFFRPRSSKQFGAVLSGGTALEASHPNYMVEDLANMEGLRGNDRRLMENALFRRRIRVACMEEAADLATASADGVYSDSDRAACDAKRRARIEKEPPFVRNLALAFTGLAQPTDDETAVRDAQNSVAADVILELAGGPVAKPGPDVLVYKKGGRVGIRHVDSDIRWVIEAGEIRIENVRQGGLP